MIVAVHPTALGPAAGGLRLWHYPDWRDGLTDALRLSTAMTAKFAVAGLPSGGGKAVVVLPEGTVPEPDRRRAVLDDVADTIESLGGAYATGPDVGTGSDDMAVIGRITPHVFCRPAHLGGSGDSSPHTARRSPRCAPSAGGCTAPSGWTDAGWPWPVWVGSARASPGCSPPRAPP
ncbi:Glu/Leu/Phe/Val dehydrogenase dimerization domain-containing protein [Streptomyces cinerochromogenes]|uniref:Valine dehydrogenase n=1 Tax=Streptomyces cinerochromogenes TaxID=66422 RepID=A0ABW7BK33_9ACTN